MKTNREILDRLNELIVSTAKQLDDARQSDHVVREAILHAKIDMLASLKEFIYSG